MDDIMFDIIIFGSREILEKFISDNWTEKGFCNSNNVPQSMTLYNGFINFSSHMGSDYLVCSTIRDYCRKNNLPVYFKTTFENSNINYEFFDKSAVGVGDWCVFNSFTSTTNIRKRL